MYDYDWNNNSNNSNNSNSNSNNNNNNDNDNDNVNDNDNDNDKHNKNGHYQSRSGHDYLSTLLTPLKPCVSNIEIRSQKGASGQHCPARCLFYNWKNIYKWFGMNMCVYLKMGTCHISNRNTCWFECETTGFLASKAWDIPKYNKTCVCFQTSHSAYSCHIFHHSRGFTVVGASICTTWKVDGATSMYWFIMTIRKLLGVAPSTFTTVYKGLADLFVGHTHTHTKVKHHPHCHESPLNHAETPRLSELRPRTCVFLQGRGLAMCDWQHRHTCDPQSQCRQQPREAALHSKFMEFIAKKCQFRDV